MPTLNIDGVGKVKVDDTFLTLSPSDQQKTVDEIRASAPRVSKAPVVEAAQETSTRDSVLAATGGMIEGVPIVGPAIQSGADKLAAFIRSKRDGTTFDQELAAVRGDYSRAAEANPKTNMGGKVAGAVGSMIPLGSTALGAKALGITGKSLGSRLAAGTASGAAISGGDAAVRSGGDPMAAAQGAGMGAAAGVAGPIIGNAAGAAYRAATGAVARPITQAEAFAARALRDDDLTPALAKEQLSGMGSDAMLADLGPNLSQQTGGLASMPGKGQKIIRDAMRARTENAGGRVKDAISTTVGGKKDVPALAAQIAADQAEAAAPLYRAVHPKPVEATPDVKAILDTPMGKVAWSKASRMAANERAPISKDALTVRALDMTKQAMDDMHRVAQKSGRGNEARVVNNLRKDLLSAVDDVEPDYATARAAFAGPAAVQDALEAGQSVFSKSTSVDELRQTLTSMGSGEKKAFIIGARAQIDEIMGTARSDAAAARAMFKQGWNAEKLQLIIGKDRADDLLKKLGTEGRFQGTSQRVAENSESAARLAAQRELGGAVPSEGLGIRGGYVSGGMLGTLRAVGLKGGEAGLEALRGKSKDAVRRELAKMLTVTGPEREAVLDRLSTAVVFSKKGQAAKAAAQSLSAGAAPAYSQAR